MRFRRVYSPATLPEIFTGLRIGFGQSLVLTISMEILSSGRGLCSIIWTAWQTFSLNGSTLGWPWRRFSVQPPYGCSAAWNVSSCSGMSGHTLKTFSDVVRKTPNVGRVAVAEDRTGYLVNRFAEGVASLAAHPQVRPPLDRRGEPTVKGS